MVPGGNGEERGEGIINFHIVIQKYLGDCIFVAPNLTMKKDTTAIPFSSYQKFAIFILAITQFTVILDFMVMSPMGAIIMKTMSLTPTQFGMAVSSYAFSAGISGFLAAGFADRFDRKKLLLFFYTGFIAGTVFCGLSNTYPLLIAARIITGIFGGVIGSVSLAIMADIFDIHHRGRVMGFIQMGFGASQVLGVPVSLYVASAWGWQSPFLMIAAVASIVAVLIMTRMEPVNKHLGLQKDHNAFQHLWNTIAKRDYRIGFLATALLSIGGYMLMPFGSAFAMNNLRISELQLPVLFMTSGVSSLFIMPLVGKLSDKVDKFTIYAIASIWMMVVVLLYTNLSVTPLWIVMIFNVCMMMGMLSRMIPASALTTGIPEMNDRGAFMSINASLQQIAGGVAAVFAGKIITQKDKFSPLEHYNTLGYVIIGISVVAIFLVYRVSVVVKRKLAEPRI